MTDARSRYQKLFGSGDSTERIEFFSDAVFAIAMTLLVLDIKVPDVKATELWPALVELLPEYFAYALSFVTIALNWMSHHRKFRVITGFTTGLLRLNLLLLLLVAFVPFPTALLSEYAEIPSVILYAATLGAIGLVQTAIWAYAHRKGLLSSSVDDGIYRYARADGFVNPAIFLASIVVAALGAHTLAMFTWILMWPASIIVSLLFGRRKP